jgi:hypothetical protein
MGMIKVKRSHGFWKYQPNDRVIDKSTGKSLTVLAYEYNQAFPSYKVSGESGIEEIHRKTDLEKKTRLRKEGYD